MKAKSLIAILLIGSILLTGCAQSIGNSEIINQSEAVTVSTNSESEIIGTESAVSDNASETTEATTTVLGTDSVPSDNASETTNANTFTTEAESANFQTTIDPSEFTGPNDNNFLQYVKDATYAEAVKNLNSTDYVVENVEVTYISPEYIAELEYNSKVNIYFGHTEEEIIKEFNGEQVVFTMDEKGQTTVEKFVPNGKGLDPVYKKALIKAGIGVGVILVCVVVSVATDGTAPAVAAVFAFSAKSAAIGAAISGTTGGVLSGLVEGFRNKNFDRAAKAAAESAGDGIMWGSICGAISGGVSEFKFLRKLSKVTGIKMKDIAIIQKESLLPIDVIEKLNSMEEYKILRDAKLKLTEMTVKGEAHPFLLRSDIDWNYIDPKTISAKHPKGETNLELALRGRAPYDLTGKKYELHHVGQHRDTVFAVLSDAEHSKIPTPGVGVDREGFDAFREAFWEKVGKLVQLGILT